MKIEVVKMRTSTLVVEAASLEQARQRFLRAEARKSKQIIHAEMMEFAEIFDRQIEPKK